MEESKGIYVTDSQIRLNVRKEYHQQYHPYTLTNDVGVQFDTRRELDCYKNCIWVSKYEQKRYGAPRVACGAWGMRRSTLDVGVGSVKALSRRRVRKVYVADIGVGSGNLTSLVNLSLRPKSRYRPRTRESREARGGAWRGARGGWGGGRGATRDLRRTASKCVGGPSASAIVHSVSAKLSPILLTRSGATSPIANQNDSKDSRGTEMDQFGSVGTAHGSVGSKNQMSLMMKNQKQSKLTYKPTTKRKNKTIDNSSDSLLQKVHEYEESQDEDEIEDETLENELEREYRKIFEPAEPGPKLAKKSTSLFKRKFSAFRKSVTKKDSPSAVEPVEVVETLESEEAPSMRDASVTSDPPSLESRSYTSDRSGNRRKRSHFAYKHSSHRKADTNWSRTPMGIDSEYSQGVKGMFKLWGKKFNFEEPAPPKDAPDSQELKSTNASPKPSFDRMEGKPKDRGEPVPVKEIKKTIGDTLSIESKQCKSKNKRFFFFKKKPSKDTKGPSVAAVAYKNEPVTTQRCELTEGLNIQLRPQTPHPHPKPNPPRQKSVDKNKSIKSIEKYEEMLKAAWLMKYLTAPIESRNSVRVRWNNGMYYASSSSTVFELMEDLYNGNRLILSQSDYTSISTTISSKYINSRGQFLQAFHAYMIPRMIHNNRIKSSNNIITMSRNKPDDSEIEVTKSDQKWYIEKSKAFSNQIEVVLHKLRSHKLGELKEPGASCLKINIPNDFFGERTSDILLQLTSDEEVYKIVEYESDGPCDRHSPLTIKSKVSNSGDYETEDTRMEQYKKTTIENLRVTISIQDEGTWDGRPRDTVIKRPPVHRDVLTQGSLVYLPRYSAGVGTVGRVGTDTARDGPPSLLFPEYFDEESNQKRKQKANHNCGFAKSFLRSDYQRWVPSSLALFARHASDSHAACCPCVSYLCTPTLPPARSCPLMPEEYYFGRFSVLSCSTPDKDERQGMYECHESYTRANLTAKLLPKDSYKLFRTRVCRTQCKKDSSVKDRPYSVPSESSTGGQAHPCGSAKRAGIVSFICKEVCGQEAESQGLPSGDKCRINDFHTSASGVNFCKESSMSSSNYIETALKLSENTENIENLISRSSLLIDMSSSRSSEVTTDQPMPSSLQPTPEPSSAYDSRVCSVKAESLTISDESRSRGDLGTLSADRPPDHSASLQVKKISVESVRKPSSDEAPVYMMADGEEKKSNRKVHKPNLLKRWISPLSKSRYIAKQFIAKEQPGTYLEPTSNVELTISSSTGSGSPGHSCNCTPGSSSSAVPDRGTDLNTNGEDTLSQINEVFLSEIKSCDGPTICKTTDDSVLNEGIKISGPRICKTTDDSVLNEGIKISVDRKTTDIYKRECREQKRAEEIDTQPGGMNRDGGGAVDGCDCFIAPKNNEPLKSSLWIKPKGQRTVDYTQPPCPSKPSDLSQPPCPPKPLCLSPLSCPPKPSDLSQPPCPPKPLCLSPLPCPPEPSDLSQPPCPPKPPQKESNCMLNKQKKDCDFCWCPPCSYSCSSSSSTSMTRKKKIVTANSNTRDLELVKGKPCDTSASNKTLLSDSSRADKIPKNKPLKAIPRHACAPRNIGRCPTPEKSEQQIQPVNLMIPTEHRPDAPKPMNVPYTCITCSSGFDTSMYGATYQSSRDPPQHDGDDLAPATSPGPPSCRVAVSQAKDKASGFQCGDSLISVESCNYSKGLTETAPLINNLYKNSKVEHVPTNVRKKKANADSTSDASSSNVIEINVNFKLNQGDKTTEIKIDKDNESKILKTNETKTNKSVANLPNNVFVVNSSSQRKNHFKETNPDDLNIRILIKNQKAGKKGKSKKPIGDAHNVTTKKYSNASTEYRAALQDANVDAHFSVQRITVGVMQSFNQAHLAPCDKALSSAVVLMCSKSLLAIKSSILKVMRIAGTSPGFSALYCKSVPAIPTGDSDAPTDPYGTSGSHSLHLTRSTPTISVSAGQASSTQRSILIKCSKSEKSSNSDKFCKSEDFTTTEKTSKGGFEDEEHARGLKNKIHKSTKRISFTDTELSENPELNFKITDEPFTDSKSGNDTHITPKVRDGNGLDALENTSDDDESVILEEIPSAEVTVKTLKEEKKDMLKQVFEKGLYLKNPKNERRIQKMKDLLKAILTDDSDSDPKHDPVCVHHCCKRSDSMSNLYKEFNAVVPSSSREKADDDSGSARSIIREPDKSKCYCKQLSTKLMLKGKGCSCAKAVQRNDKAVTCNLSSLFAFNGMDGMSYWIPSVECVHVQTVNSRYEGSSQEPLPPAGNDQLLVKKSAEIHFQDKQDELKKEQINEGLKERKSYSSKRFIKEVTYIDVPDSHIAGLHGHRSLRRGLIGSLGGGADVLQMYETKKAVLEIYAEKTVSDQGEHFVAKLPKFVHSAEGCLYKNVAWNRVLGPEILS